MKAFVITKKETTLILSQEETDWLSGMVQNKLHKDESLNDAAMRKAFWDALHPPSAGPSSSAD